MLRYLRELGVTAVELMPVRGVRRARGARAQQDQLLGLPRALRSWRPTRFSSSGDRGGQSKEFRAAVAALLGGIEG
ncbi:MAG: hypothetical protein IPJ34_13055 [Myxococcales bacterium]|nr:hypothetical protein [Myxococcales bacterium]